MTKILVGRLRGIYHLTAFALVALVLSSHAHADLVLTLASEIVTFQDTNDSDDAPQTQYDEWLVRLGGDHLHFTGNEELIYDFNKQVIYTINRKANTYLVASLFANVGFRDHEMRNREYMIRVLREARATDIPMSLGFSEHELSVISKDSKLDISQERGNDQTVFSAEGETMLMVSGPAINVPEKYQQEFLRFFRHRFGGHPSIIGEILAPAGIYKDITIWHRNIVDKKIHLRIKSIEEIPSSNYANFLAGLEKSIQTDARLLTLIDRLGETPAKQRKQIENNILEDAHGLIKENDLEGAMLAYLEYMLITGSQMPPWSLAEQKLLLGSDKVKTMLAASQNPSNKEAAESAVKALEAIREKQTAGAHILTIFEANTRAAMGEPERARDLMLDALSENPYIAGAWKDLGGFYYNNYEPYKAWLCWDTARIINPSHPLLDSVNNFENQLINKYPEFF